MRYENLSTDKQKVAASVQLITDSLSIDNFTELNTSYTCKTVCTDDECKPDKCDLNKPSQNDTCQSLANTGTIFMLDNDYCNREVGSCYRGPSTPDGSNYEIKRDRVLICGSINGKKTCTPPGAENSTYGVCDMLNNEWETNRDIKSPRSGKITCRYEYDFSGFVYFQNRDVYANDFFNWIKNLNLPDLVVFYLRDTGFIYLSIVAFYQNLFESKTKFDPITPPDIKSLVLSFTKSRLSNLYPQSKISDNLLKNVENSLLFPVVSKDENDFYLTFMISDLQYQKFLVNSSNLSSFYSSFFSDTLAKYDCASGSCKPVLDPEFDILDSTTVNCIIVNFSTYLYVENISKETLLANCQTNPSCCSLNFPNYFITTHNIRCRIKKWSPILLAYVNSKIPGLVFTQQQIEKIISDTSLLPIQAFNQECVLNIDTDQGKQKCLNYVQNFCGKVYIAPPHILPQSIDNNIIVSTVKGGGGICQCYNSLLQPLQWSNPGNETAMCFDRSCSNNTLAQKLFNLNDTKCQNKCSTLRDWITTKDDSKRVKNVSILDSDRYKRLCGDDYVPNYEKKNYKLYIVGVVLIFCVLVRFRKNIFVGIIISGIILFIVYNLNGKAMCTQNGKVCTMRNGKIRIPADFCDNYNDLSCECRGFDSDCPNGCKCFSGLCYPSNGKRGVKTVVVKKIDYKILFLCVGLLIILMSSNIEEKKYYTGMITLICIIVYLVTRKETKEVFDGKCGLPSTTLSSTQDIQSTQDTCPAPKFCVNNSNSRWVDLDTFDPVKCENDELITGVCGGRELRKCRNDKGDLVYNRIRCSKTNFNPQLDQSQNSVFLQTGEYNDYMNCPYAYAADGMCISSGGKQCPNGMQKSINCVKNLVMLNPKEDDSYYVFDENPDSGSHLTCDEGYVVSGYCRGGRNSDCLIREDLKRRNSKGEEIKTERMASHAVIKCSRCHSAV